MARKLDIDGQIWHWNVGKTYVWARHCKEKLLVPKDQLGEAVTPKLVVEWIKNTKA